jgi:anti-sigma factor RsiW
MPGSDDIFDDQALGSFVDGLLDAAHTGKIIKAMEDDPEIRERVYQLRRTKDLMKLGFADASTRPGNIAPVNTAKEKPGNWKLFFTRYCRIHHSPDRHLLRCHAWPLAP